MAEPTGEAGGVGFHVSRHEYETGQAEAETYEGDVQDGLFEDDVDVAVVRGAVSVGGPPEIDPVIVELGDRMLVRAERKDESASPGDWR